MWYCTSCGKENGEDYRFCVACGQPCARETGAQTQAFAADPEEDPAELWAQPKKKSRWWIWLLAVLAVLAAAAAVCYFTVHLWRPASCAQAETCAICGKERSPAWGHNWCEWQTESEPDCEFSGVQVRTCLRCGATETREVPALGHLWAEATQTSPRTCLRCGATEGEPLPAAEAPAETPTEAPAEQSEPEEPAETRVALSELSASRCSADGGFIFYTYGHDNQDIWYDNAIGGSLADTDNWLEFELNGEYDEISGTVYMNYEFRSETARHVKLSIYGDGKLLYSSAIISKGVQPESFWVDLSGVQTLKLVIYGNDYLRLSDCQLVRSGS